MGETTAFESLEELSGRTQKVVESRYRKVKSIFEPEIAFFRDGKIMSFEILGEEVSAVSPVNPVLFELIQELAEENDAEYFSAIFMISTIPQGEDTPEDLRNDLLVTVSGDRVGNRIIRATTVDGRSHPIAGTFQFNLRDGNKLKLPEGTLTYNGMLDPWPESPTIN